MGITESAQPGPEDSIYEFIRSRLDRDGKLEDSQMRLPDEEPAPDDGVKWASGALDGVLGHHAGGAGEDDSGPRVAALFGNAAQRRDAESMEALMIAIPKDRGLALVDPLIAQLSRMGLTVEGVRHVSRWLATTAPRRDPVKVGMALLGATGLQEDLALVHVLGAHEEFTLYAAVAFRNGAADPENEIWELAKRVRAWGRIQCVDRLRGTENPQIQDWILREGWRNGVMYEYLADAAASTGRLAQRLDTPAPDRGLLDAAGEVLQTLADAVVDGGPAGDLDSYDQAARAVDLYTAHLAASGSTVQDACTLIALHRFLVDATEWDDRVGTNGWTPQNRAALTQRIESMLRDPRWPHILQAALDQGGPDLWKTDSAARALGMDTFDALFAALQKQPDSYLWHQAWAQADAPRTRKLADLSRSTLPLDRLCEGPGEAAPFGPLTQARMRHDAAITHLARYPGVADDLVIVGLSSIYSATRRAAVHTLYAWGPANWPDGAVAALYRMIAAEPDEEIRAQASALLE